MIPIKIALHKKPLGVTDATSLFPTGAVTGGGEGSGEWASTVWPAATASQGIIFRPAADALLSLSHSSRLAESQICAAPFPAPSIPHFPLWISTTDSCQDRAVGPKTLTHPPTMFLHVYAKLVCIWFKNSTACHSSCLWV